MKLFYPPSRVSVTTAIADIKRHLEGLKNFVTHEDGTVKQPFQRCKTYGENIDVVVNRLEGEMETSMPGALNEYLVNELDRVPYEDPIKTYEARVDRWVNGHLNHFFPSSWGFSVTPQCTFAMVTTNEHLRAAQDTWSHIGARGEDSRMSDLEIWHQPEDSSSSLLLSPRPPGEFTLDPPDKVPDITHFESLDFDFVPQQHSTPTQDISELPGTTLDQYNRLVPNNRHIRKPDFIVEYDDKARIIVEDKIKHAKAAIQQLVGYLEQFTKDQLDSDVPTPVGLCYVLMNDELQVAVLRESETRRGEIVGVGSEDAPANQFFDSLIWHSPASQDVTDILLGIINECKAT